MPPGSDVGAAQSYEDVLVVGQPAQLLGYIAPPGTTALRLDLTGELQLRWAESADPVPTATDIPLAATQGPVLVWARTPSVQLGDRSLRAAFLDAAGHPLVRYELVLTALRISLDVDADRDGVVEQDSPHKAHWKWGPSGFGAILLVNNDRDMANRANWRRDRLDERVGGPLDVEDLSPWVVRKAGPQVLPPGCELRLQVTDAASQRIRIFNRAAEGGRQLIGPGVPQATLPDVREEIQLGAEGLQYPDRDFSGLVTIDLVLARNEEQLHDDRVVFRVAPWIMTPNTLDPVKAYVCRLADGSNVEMIERLRSVAQNAGAEVVEAAPQLNRGDRWMQDEIEIGYSQSPAKQFPVVLDSPRDRGLDAFPEEALLGPDFGYVARTATDTQPNSLDSFGNLEVSPPVTVNGVDYPLGRILFGGALPTVTAGRRIMHVVRDFLYGQQVQPPIELYSDWLVVGHVDEFLCFVPAPTAKGFKLLLASPEACYRLLQQLEAAGHGAAVLFEGRTRSGVPADVQVSSLLRDPRLAAHNRRYQSYIDWNRAVLRSELGLDERDVIDIPALFQPEDNAGRAGAYFPDMVNMIVLGKHAGIPQPFGPKVDGKCQFEAYVERALETAGITCHFIDDWYSYHLLLGEVHCGTNTLRRPFAFPWWNMRPFGIADL